MVGLVRRLVAGVVVAVLAACAAGPRTMRYAPQEGQDLHVWPAAHTQEVPRYRYLGELTGQGNFAAGNEAGAQARRALSLLVGLDERDPDPTVLQRPQAGTVDASGRILVTDVSRRAVLAFDEERGTLSVWEDAGPQLPFEVPVGIAAGRDGEVLVADAGLRRVVRLDRDGRPLGTFGERVLRRPTGIARDAARGLVFVADTHAHDIKVFDDDGRLVDTVGHRGDGPGEFNFPTHLWFARGRLYVTDNLNARIQVLSATGEVALRFGERGLFVGNLVRPKGVATDDEGNIYVVESLYDTLLVFDPEGRLLLSIGGTGAGVGKFFLPAGVWVDARNRVFVADMFNGRVVMFHFLGGS